MLTPSYIWAQGKGKNIQSENTPTPLYQGISTGVDIAGLGSYALGGDVLNAEMYIQANFKNRFMPIAEFGFASTDKTDDDSDMHFKTSAPYFRVGLDYNAFYKKTHLPGYIFVGLRMGFSSFKYDVDGPDMVDPNYGGQTVVPYSFQGLKSHATWAEAVAGLKVKIYKGFCMGWCVRYKKSFSVKDHPNSRPWYIPGFGKNSSTCFTVSYNLIYNLPF